MARKLTYLSLALLLLVGAILAGGWWWVRRAFPPTQGTLTLAGLEAPVEIRRDELGVPHIYASNEHDLYFAQGVVHAQDRLWQIDFQRRVGLGRLSEILGEPALKTDRFLRTVGTHEAAQRDWEALDSRTQAILSAYAEGINAYMATDPVLPLEYQLLGAKWEPWEPYHTLAWGKMMQWDLNGDWEEELMRAQLIERIGPEYTAQLLNDGTLVGTTLPYEVGNPDWSALYESLALARVALTGPGQGRGSNAWVVSGERSATGNPLVASDPHLGIGIPATWYAVGLHAPGMDVVGASLPGVPAVVIGHNAYVAWGVTNLPTDTQDLFIERVDEATQRYEWQGEMLPLEVRTERIKVKGQEDHLMEVRATRHGPLMNEVIEGLEQPLAFQWRATQAPTRLSEAILAINRATTSEELLAATQRWDSPAQNMVYADVAGNIGYVAMGELPIRPASGGLLPQPGWSGEWEWTGLVPFAEAPQIVNPPEGYLITANESPYPADYPYYVGAAFNVPFRAERIRQLIEGDEALTVDEFEAFQGDVTSLAVPKLLDHLVAQPSEDIIVQRAQEQLRSWNRVLDSELPGAGIYEVTRVFVVRELLADELGQDEAGQELMEEYLRYAADHVWLVERLLDEPGHPLWDDTRTSATESRDEILQRALLAMSDWMGRRFGDVPHEWAWGRLHTATFDHPLGAQPPLDRIFNRTLTGVSGDRTTVNATGFSDYESLAVSNIPSYRQVVEVGNWENSRMLHTTGQSGQPFHPHYDDMLQRWLHVELAPMLWSDAQSAAASQGRVLTLQPATP